MGRSSNEELGHHVVCCLSISFCNAFTMSITPCAATSCNRNYGFAVYRYTANLAFGASRQGGLGARIGERGELPGIPARSRGPALRPRASSTRASALTHSPRLAAPPRRLQPKYRVDRDFGVAPCRQSPSVPRRERLRYCGTACKKLTQGTQGLAWLRPLSIVASPAPNSPPTPRVNWTEAPPLTV